MVLNLILCDFLRLSHIFNEQPFAIRSPFALRLRVLESVLTLVTVDHEPGPRAVEEAGRALEDQQAHDRLLRKKFFPLKTFKKKCFVLRCFR